VPQGVPSETQLAQALHVRPGLVSKCRSIRGRRVRRADAKNPFIPSQIPYPFPVAAQVAVAGVAQAAGVRVDDAEGRQAAVVLPHDRTGHRWPVLLKRMWATPASLSLPAGKSPTRSPRGPRAGQQHPAGLLVAALGSAVAGVFFKERPRHFVRHQDTLERRIVRGNRGDDFARRRRFRFGAPPRPPKVAE